jgi:hypothetical protein
MLRTRLLGASLLSLTLLSSGCRLFDPDRPRFCDRCHERHCGQVNAAPVGYAGPTDAGCGATVIPPAPGGAIYGQPIYVGPNGGPIGSFPGSETSPPPGAPPLRIPKAGIEEKGKQFELEGGSRGGPVLMIPAANIKP